MAPRLSISLCSTRRELRTGRGLRRPERSAALEHAGRQHERARERPSHFLRWLWAHDLPEHPAAAIPPSGHAFVARGVYGRYLRDVLDAAEAAAPRDVRLNRIGRGVVGLTDEHGVLWLKLDDDSTCVADVAVLCIGNLPPRLPRAPGVDAISGRRRSAIPGTRRASRGSSRPMRSGAGQRPDDGRCCDPACRPRPPGSHSGAVAARPAAQGARANTARAALGMAGRAADRARPAAAHPPRDRACRACRDRLAGRARRLARARALAVAPSADRRAPAISPPPATRLGHPPPSHGARDRRPDQGDAGERSARGQGRHDRGVPSRSGRGSRCASETGAAGSRSGSSATGS